MKNKALNTICPWSKKSVSKSALTSYLGYLVGFCNSRCRDKFSDAEKQFKELMTGEQKHPLKSAFLRLAQYNQWFNRRLYHAASALSETELTIDRGAFFKSIFDTLNHILVWDITRLKRTAIHDSNDQSLAALSNFPTPKSHRHKLFPDLNGQKSG